MKLERGTGAGTYPGTPAPTAEGVGTARALFAQAGAIPNPTVAQRRAGYEELMAHLPLPGEADAVVETLPIGGIPCVSVLAAGADPNRVIGYFHGGGYVIGSAAGYVGMGWGVSATVSARVLLVDYRLAPECPYPAAIEDAVAVLGHARDELGAGKLFAMGDSAGGGLAIGATMALRDQGNPLPDAVVSISPLLDLAGTAETLDWNAGREVVVSRAALLANGGGVYLDGRVAGETPWASPIYGNPKGLPPTLVMSGAAEALLDDSLRFYRALLAEGVSAELLVEPGMFHCWPLFWATIDEAQRALDVAAEFLART